MAHSLWPKRKNKGLKIAPFGVIFSEACLRQLLNSMSIVMIVFALDVHIAACKGGSMTESLFNEYVDQVIRKRAGAIFNPPTLLLMDHATSHKVIKAKIDFCDVLL